MKKVFFLVAGNFSLSLGIIGIFLPVLPTTPFLLLSAACYMKSSKRLYTWLLGHPILGLYVQSYLKYKAVTVKAKIISISLLWGVISSTIIFFINLTWLRILLLLIATGVSIHLIRMKTLTREMRREAAEGAVIGDGEKE